MHSPGAGIAGGHAGFSQEQAGLQIGQDEPLGSDEVLQRREPRAGPRR